MDALLIGAALAAGLAGFYLVLGLETLTTGNRRVFRARTLDTRLQPVNRTRTESRSRWRPLISGDSTELALVRAGWPIRVREYRFLRILTAGGCCILGLFVASALGFSGVFSFVIMALFGFFGSFVPSRYVAFRTERRLLKVENQLPEALAMMAKSLKAGLGLLQAFDYAANETAEPLGPELQRTLRDLQLGSDAEVVFRELSRRVGSSDLDIATTAIMIQRTVGGNLSEILENVAHTIRERHQLKSEAHVLTTRQRLTGNLVAGMPVLIVALFFLINPDVAGLLISETVGRFALAIGIAFELLGLWLIRKLAVIEV